MSKVIELAFGVVGQLSRRNVVLDGGRNPPPHGNGNFFGRGEFGSTVLHINNAASAQITFGFLVSVKNRDVPDSNF